MQPTYLNPTGTKALLIRTQRALHLTQKTLGDLMGCSRRTIIRHQARGGIVLPTTWEKLAVAVYPHDAVLAADLAARAGKTLVDLGLEKPPPPPAPPIPPRPLPSAKHLNDSIVCAAAEAMQVTPQAARPAVVAAFARAVALGMSAEEVLHAEAEAAPATADAKHKRGAAP